MQHRLCGFHHTYLVGLFHSITMTCTPNRNCSIPFDNQRRSGNTFDSTDHDGKIFVAWNSF